MRARGFALSLTRRLTLAAALIALATGTLLSRQASAQSAVRVLGQPDFSSTVCGDITPGTLCAPLGVAVDPGGRLFVSDSTNNRVLSWPSAANFGNGDSADLVLGQSDFVGNACADPTTPGSLCYPTDVAIAPNGRLLVADTDTNRVLSWPSAASVRSGQPADRVLGQSKFNEMDCADETGQASLCGPLGLAFSQDGRLVVADTINNRVLVWNKGADLSNGQKADVVLGQAGFRQDECEDPSAARLCGPREVVVDKAGRLFVTDADNNRILSWPNVAQLANGQAADLVLGQSNFEDNLCNQNGVGAASLCGPGGLAIAPSGRLYAADAGNSRVLSWPSTSGLANGQPADQVIGQPDFSTSDCPPTASASSLCNPNGLAFDADGRLYVADSGNNRLLVFDAR
jgi:DNA-binding beta-propeller fold protein YncE